MIHSQLKQWNINNKKIILRADLNVPLNNGTILNDFRLHSILPTLNYIIDNNGGIILITHIGRPSMYDPHLSTQILVRWFQEREYTILYVPDIISIAQHKNISKQILLVENLRFFPEEKNGDPFFAKQLARSGDFYVNDAFGLIHESDCSVSLLPYEFPENKRSIGFLIEKELRALDSLKNNPPRPFTAILGGGKIKDKIPLIIGLLKNIDSLILCPALCFSFLKAMGESVGKSVVDETTHQQCLDIITQAHAQGVQLLFPIDYQVALNDFNGPLSEVPADNFPENAVGISLGSQSIELFTKTINESKIIFLNCAMGFENKEKTRQSTYSLIQTIAHSTANTVIAGGDSVTAAFHCGAASSITHLSSGGGAALAYLSDNYLPGLAPFIEE